MPRDMLIMGGQDDIPPPYHPSKKLTEVISPGAIKCASHFRLSFG